MKELAALVEAAKEVDEEYPSYKVHGELKSALLALSKAIEAYERVLSKQADVTIFTETFDEDVAALDAAAQGEEKVKPDQMIGPRKRTWREKVDEMKLSMGEPDATFTLPRFEGEPPVGEPDATFTRSVKEMIDSEVPDIRASVKYGKIGKCEKCGKVHQAAVMCELVPRKKPPVEKECICPKCDRDVCRVWDSTGEKWQTRAEVAEGRLKELEPLVRFLLDAMANDDTEGANRYHRKLWDLLEMGGKLPEGKPRRRVYTVENAKQLEDALEVEPPVVEEIVPSWQHVAETWEAACKACEGRWKALRKKLKTHRQYTVISWMDEIANGVMKEKKG